MRYCDANTKKGDYCGRRCVPYTDFCRLHQPKDEPEEKPASGCPFKPSRGRPPSDPYYQKCGLCGRILGDHSWLV